MSSITVPKGFSVEKARNIQIALSKKVVKRDVLPRDIRYVAGVDVAYMAEFSIGSVVVLEFRSLSPVEFEASIVRTRFPYVPTLLSFRELPPIISALSKLRISPDVFLVDGHGLAHPYRLGFASHLGVTINKPTIGVAKKLLCGTVEKPANREEVSFIRENDEVLGAALFLKFSKKPIYVSIGHMVSLETAIKIVKMCVRRGRIPEPIRLAHLKANDEKKKLSRARVENP